MGNLGIDGTIMLKLILKKKKCKGVNGFIWLRAEYSDRLVNIQVP